MVKRKINIPRRAMWKEIAAFGVFSAGRQFMRKNFLPGMIKAKKSLHLLADCGML